MNTAPVTPASIFKAVDLVSYAEGSVVSRTIQENKGGTVTLFAFDSGQGLSEHTAPFNAMVTLLDGEAEIIIGGSPHHLHAGESIVMPAGIPHALRALTRFKMQLIMLRA